MTMHEAPDALLTEYANGTATPGLALLVASHLTYAADARARVEGLERIGGALLAGAADEPVDRRTRERTLAAIAALAEAAADLPDDDAPRAGADAAEAGDETAAFPAPLRAVLGGAPKWRFRLPGVSEAVLDAFEGEHVSLLRARPGAAIPQHTHEGREITLVMQGAMADGDRVYRAGDLAVNDEDDDHRPRIIGEETCLCLVWMEGSMRFTGRFSRALNLLGE